MGGTPPLPLAAVLPAKLPSARPRAAGAGAGAASRGSRSAVPSAAKVLGLGLCRPCCALRAAPPPPLPCHVPPSLLSRRDLLAGSSRIGLLVAAFATAPSGALAAANASRELSRAFQEAMDAGQDFDAADKAWTRCVELAPDNAPAWSNRGTLRLQFGKWEDARSDLQHARELEEGAGGEANALLLNNLGNSKGACGDWEGAKKDFLAASQDASIESIALANLALASFQTGDAEGAVRVARQVLRRDPNFLDMQAALVAFMWGSGKEAEAEAEWNRLQQAGDGLGGQLYGRSVAVARVAPRWPPRPAAALSAFLSLTREADALGYNGTRSVYKF
mmetsp:Transcript_25082/g.79498  ORF Transcript_25082/g.79498 Transcript_25082/m.79498 type:complete len:334 (+) Transcript_25082:827-1828(+)|eukprot:CAMPEP_0182853316 /NCGR_PEP_ID=MMETSP0034_2-20130328/635_1 /TAXON_ID=156128 /ORGANISM="Nephroselmis pyriformis, Strain CCMP717" /LENGTH=333 /DNA_ID=CAMNT_0024984079 /DNA_START=352 /DNA_END=1353 /DNA_ORIENTATION=+